MLHFCLAFLAAQALHLFQTGFFSNYKSLVVLHSTIVQHLYKIWRSVHKTTPEFQASSVLGICIRFFSQMESYLRNGKFRIRYFAHRISSLNLSLTDPWSVIPQVPLQPCWDDGTIFSVTGKYLAVACAKVQRHDERVYNGHPELKKFVATFLKPRWLQAVLLSRQFNEPRSICRSNLRMPSSSATSDFMGQRKYYSG